MDSRTEPEVIIIQPSRGWASLLAKSSTSLVGSAHLISKVSSPRLIIRLSGMMSMLVDFGIGFVVLAVLMIAYQMPLTWNVL